MAGGASAADALVDGDTIRYTAAVGEVNAVELIVALFGVRINDPGATIAAGPGCVSLRADSVNCFHPRPFQPDDDRLTISVRTRDGNDSIRGRDLGGSGARAAGLRWHGGTGNDRLRTCVSRDSRANVLTGGPGTDRIDLCPFEDLSFGAAPTWNYVFGGPGNDTLIGGFDNDVFFGGWGRDVMSGSQGRDILHGGRGADRINGGAHRDTLRGGAGRDWLVSRDRWRDRVGGGSDRDTARVDWRDVVSRVEAFLD